MAISLQNILRFAENSGQNPDGSPFDQRSLGYGDGSWAFGGPKPLIIKDLPKVDQEPNGALGFVNQVTDNFVRGGAVTLASRAVTDLVRLGKVMISPNGLSWSAAQFALSKTNPESLSSPRNRQTLPISVLATAGTGAAGIRFRKDGLIDFKMESGYNYDSTRGGPKYESRALETSKLNKPSFETQGGRLQILADPTNLDLDHTLRGIFTTVNTGGGFTGRKDLIKEYKGGAHSTFGIGNTEIKRYKSTPYGQADGNDVNIEGYLPLFNKDLFTLRQGPNPTKADSGTDGYTDYKTIGDLPNKVKSTRIDLYKMGDPGVKPTPTIPGDPGDGYGIYDIRTIDKISAASIFKRQDLKDFSGTFKDYIKFRIAVVDTENPLNDNVILFRALLDNVSDNFSGDWNSYKYNGRAEKFYTYSGFDRTITFAFKIHTQTRWEQKPLWRKLNYLVAQTAPEYKNRRMRGVFSRLTIGDWMNEIPGFFTSVNLSWSTAYPWEIRQDSEGADRDLNEYPHILDVSCNFQPVHNFAPSNSPTTPFLLPEIGVSGNRRYARISDDESADDFNENGIAADAEFADIHITSIPPPPPSPESTPIPLAASPISNDITPVENRGLM
jgi:hypothetical protein